MVGASMMCTNSNENIPRDFNSGSWNMYLLMLGLDLKDSWMGAAEGLDDARGAFGSCRCCSAPDAHLTATRAPPASHTHAYTQARAGAGPDAGCGHHMSTRRGGPPVGAL